MNMPRTFFFALTDHGPKIGIGFVCDPYDNADAALDMATSPFFEGQPFRIYRMDMLENGLPECVRDVTEDAIADRNEWLAEQGRDPIEVAA